MSIVVENVSKSFDGKPVLHDINLEIDDGAFVTLLGPGGAGKTSLMRIMAGIDRPDSGRILYDGEDVTRLPVRKRQVSFVYERFINYPSLTVFENIASPLRVSKRKRSKAEIDTKVREKADLLGLSDILHHYPEQISGGQRQRTALARALAKEARFVFLDEPLVNLDFKLREELRSELKSMFQKQGAVVVYATPEPTDALSMSSHVAFFHEGRILQYGEVQEVYRNPACAEVGAYFSYPTMNIIECECVVEEGRPVLRATDELAVDLASFSTPLEPGKYLLGVRAHALSAIQDGAGASSFKATVELAEVVGSDTELHLKHRGIRLIALMQQVYACEIGREIDVHLSTDELYVFDYKTRELVAKSNAASCQN